MNNFVDLLVPVATPGFSNRYEPLNWAKKTAQVILPMMLCKRMVNTIIVFTLAKSRIK